MSSLKEILTKNEKVKSRNLAVKNHGGLRNRKNLSDLRFYLKLYFCENLCVVWLVMLTWGKIQNTRFGQQWTKMVSSREEIFSWVKQWWDQKRSNIYVQNGVPLTKRDERFSLWKRKSKLACHRSYFLSWNTLWSFILYVKCETNCDRSYSMSWKKILKISSRYFFLKNFFHVKP